MFTVADRELAAGKLVLPELGVWHLRAHVVGDQAPPAKGTRVTAQLGDITLSGTVRASGVYVGRAELLLVGGADGWPKTIKRRTYRGDNGIRLSSVTRDLARDTGETVTLLPGAERVLGYAWTRPEGPASATADAIGVPWWVGPDGVTRFGARPTVERSSLKLGVSKLDLMGRSMTLSTPDDVFTPYVPGTFISGETIPRVRVRTSTIRIASQSVTVGVLWT